MRKILVWTWGVVWAGCALVAAVAEQAVFEVKRLPDDGTRLAICNVGTVAPSNRVVCRWTAYDEGVHKADGTYRLLVGRKGDQPLAPQGRVVVAIPPIVGAIAKRNHEAALRVRFMLPNASGEERELHATQLDFPRHGVAPALEVARLDAAVEVVEDARSIVFGADGVTYSFCRKTGALYSVKTGCLFEHEWLREPMRPEFARAGIADGDALVCTGAEVSAVTNDGHVASFTVVSRWRSERWTERDSALVAAHCWTVRGDGALVCQAMFVWDGSPVEVARIGYHCGFADEELLVDYYGAGPAERGGFLGRYGVRAADCGTRAKARSVSFDAGWDHLSFTTCAGPFDFSVTGGKAATCAIYDGAGAWRHHDFAFVIRPEKGDGAVSVLSVRMPPVELRSSAARKKAGAR